VKRGRGKVGEPIKWTGWAPRLECENEANPVLVRHDSGDELTQVGGSHLHPGSFQDEISHRVNLVRPVAR
jgi:hypothetical protein